MSLNASRSKLVALTRELAGQWQQTRDSWNDAKSQEFDHRFMEELLAGVNTACTNLENLDRVLTKVRHDCE